MIPLNQLISLTDVPGVGPWRIRNILRKFPQISQIRDLSEKELRQVDGISVEMAARIRNLNSDTGNAALDLTSEMNARFLPFWDSCFPEILNTLDDGPVGVYVQGEIPTGIALGIVGTRSPSAYGRRLAMDFTRELVQQGFVIVSGFARGIDTICHHETQQLGGSTIAVMGCGLDVNYPAGNRMMRRELVKKGALISEFPPGTQPEAANFPRRNRIISGLSKGILIIEAGAKSGALNTAYHAVDQNREVFAVPGSIHSSRSEGCHKVIQNGAKLVTGIGDILSELPQKTARKQMELLPSLSSEEQEVFSRLTGSVRHIDELAADLQWDTGRVLTVLLDLELKDLVSQEPGMVFRKSAG